jgi:putative FmdB family regulatory protein
MPLFEYSCDDCGTTFELLAPSRRAKPKQPDCPKCGGNRTVGLVSACAVQSPAGGGVAKDACDVSLGRG